MSEAVLIERLLARLRADGETDVRLLETHISWVLLASDYAYKIKKPLNLGFLDFSTLEQRKFYCEEELRLNRRLAPDYYLNVIPITGSEQTPALNGGGAPLDYAVQMRRFPQQSLLDQLLQSGRLRTEMIDEFAELLAAFHLQKADISTCAGSPRQVCLPVVDNFHTIAQLAAQSLPDGFYPLRRWSEQQCAELAGVMKQRQQLGMIRECHGDLHLGNMAWVDNQPLVFDAIEFNPELRWIDVISEVAFMMMDLSRLGRADLAWRFINRYLQMTGDYPGVALLPFYLVYRAMVRAKIAIISGTQAEADSTAYEQQQNRFQTYLQLAQKLSRPNQPLMLMTVGLSASGKSTISQELLQRMGLIRIRSDVERKRLFVIEPHTGAEPGAGIYSQQCGEQTYAHLLRMAGKLLLAGQAVIVDAAFLHPKQRLMFLQWAQHHQIPCLMLHLKADADQLRQRIDQRAAGVSDADLAVLEHQLLHWQPLQAHEREQVLTVNTDDPVDYAALVERIRSRLGLHHFSVLP